MSNKLTVSKFECQGFVYSLSDLSCPVWRTSFLLVKHSDDRVLLNLNTWIKWWPSNPQGGTDFLVISHSLNIHFIAFKHIRYFAGFTVGRVYFLKLFDRPTSTSDRVYWPLKHQSQFTLSLTLKECGRKRMVLRRLAVVIPCPEYGHVYSTHLYFHTGEDLRWHNTFLSPKH